MFIVVTSELGSESWVTKASFNSITSKINAEKYSFLKVIIKKDKSWFCQEFNSVCFLKPEASKVFLVLDDNKKIEVNFAFIIMLGFGEDGTIQGFFETLGLPYSGCGVKTSSLCMDKAWTKRLLSSYNNCNIFPFIDWPVSYEEACEFLSSSQLFIKPAVGGSSIGMGIACSKEEFDILYKKAAFFCNKVIVEKFIKDKREVECSVFFDEAYGISEIVSKSGFYDYEAKYESSGLAECILNTDVSDDLVDLIKKQSINIAKTLEYRHLSRVDFFIVNDIPYFNEINTFPGFSDISMFPKMIIKEGKSFEFIVEKIIEDLKVS